MSGSVYVSDPRVWDEFYKNMSPRSTNKYKVKYRQIGKGLGSVRKPVSTPVNNYTNSDHKNLIKTVTPSTETVEQAKSELIYEQLNAEPYVTPTKVIKGENSNRNISKKRGMKRKTSRRSINKDQAKRRKTKKKNYSKKIKRKLQKRGSKRKPKERF